MRQINLLLGPSGSGKTTLGQRLHKELGLVELISHTTRKVRVGEVPGESYHYVTKDEFFNTPLVEWSKYDGDFYGISVAEVESKLNEYHCVYAAVNLDGVRAVQAKYGSMVRVFFIEVSYEGLKQRMLNRGDDLEKIEKRLKHVLDSKECYNHIHSDIIINNDGDLELAWQELKRHFQ